LNNQLTPYDGLDPSVILTAIESIGFACNGSLFALNSYENRVYQVGIEDSSPLIAKFYRPLRWSDEAIREEHQFANELMQHEIPVIAPIATNGKTLHEFQGYRFALFARQGGRTLELGNLDHLEWMGRFIGRLHAVGACKPFEHRMRLDAETYGRTPHRFLLENNFIPADIKNAYCNVVETLLNKIDDAFQKAGDVSHIRLHGDCHAGNVLWNNDGPQIVDLDDCLMGPAIQDIWMLVTGDTKYEVNIQLDCILDGYAEFHDFDYRELHLIEALRALRMLHYSAWLAKRWSDPAFPRSFPWFNTQSYWEEQVVNLEDQMERLL
jgi:Ser/Thr protein kinase RdoA (MazF antagonist)